MRWIPLFGRFSVLAAMAWTRPLHSRADLTDFFITLPAVSISAKIYKHINAGYLFFDNGSLLGPLLAEKVAIN
jgi:hypothetical protein